jgi:hypothetical protein
MLLRPMTQVRFLMLSALLAVPLLVSAQPTVQADSAKPGGKRDLPLIATRSARFSTSKATWMSLDVSPDGATIVFDFLGDLYRVSAPTASVLCSSPTAAVATTSGFRRSTARIQRRSRRATMR